MIELITEHPALIILVFMAGCASGVLVMCLCAMSGRGSMCEDCDYAVKFEEYKERVGKGHD